MKVTDADLKRLLPIHVRYVFFLYLAVIGTAIFWTAFYHAVIAEGLPLKNSPGPVVAFLYKSLVSAVLVLLGPVGIYQYSLNVAINADGIIITRLFGLIRRWYRLEDLGDISVVDVPKFGRQIRLRFTDGRVVSVEGHAQGADVLLATFG